MRAEGVAEIAHLVGVAESLECRHHILVAPLAGAGAHDPPDEERGEDPHAADHSGERSPERLRHLWDSVRARSHCDTTAEVDAMHELSLCEAIADSVARHASGRTVRRASIRVGYLRQVVPESMSFCWGILTEGTDLDGCELQIEHVPAVLACGGCGAMTTLDLPVLLCGTCGSSEVALESGDELLLVSIDLVGVS